MSSTTEDDTQSSSAMLYDVLSSATAGIISRILTHPLDTAKARLQANNTYRGPIDALFRTYKHEGIRALYRGLNAVIVGGTPGTILYLTGYAYWRDTISADVSAWNERDDTISTSARDNNKPSSLSQGQEFTVHFMSGMLAETICCIIYVPVDVVKERMQVQQQQKHKQVKNASDTYYRGSLDALQKILKTEGLRGIYKGYGATLASFGPFSALYFMFYEQCKMRARDHYIGKHDNQSSPIVKADGDLPLLYLIACSSAAGALASFLTSPLDMAKLRLQIQRGQAAASNNVGRGQTVQYKGMVDCLHSAYNKGGIRGLFRGAGARVIHFAPATTITMTCYEKCKTFYADALG